MAVDGNGQRPQPEALYATEKVGMPEQVAEALEVVLMSVRERKGTAVSRAQRARAAATAAMDLWRFAGREADRLEREGDERGAAVVRQAEDALGRLDRRLRSFGRIGGRLDGLHGEPCLRATVAVELEPQVRALVSRFVLLIKQIHATQPVGSQALTMTRIAALREDMSALVAYVENNRGSEVVDESTVASAVELAEVAERMREGRAPVEAAADPVDERDEESGS